jgi:hypothetical protein
MQNMHSGRITVYAELCQIFAGSSPGSFDPGPAGSKKHPAHSSGAVGLGCTGWQDKSELLTAQVAE